MVALLRSNIFGRLDLKYFWQRAGSSRRDKGREGEYHRIFRLAGPAELSWDCWQQPRFKCQVWLTGGGQPITAQMRCSQSEHIITFSQTRAAKYWKQKLYKSLFATKRTRNIFYTVQPDNNKILLVSSWGHRMCSVGNGGTKYRLNTCKNTYCNNISLHDFKGR